MDEFGTVLNCMDGRVQGPVSDYLLTTFGVHNLDTVTAAGVVRHVAEDTDRTRTILEDLEVSITRHGSKHIAVAAHHDCAGNPTSDTAQRDQVAEATARLTRLHPGARVIGLWVDGNWTVEQVADPG